MEENKKEPNGTSRDQKKYNIWNEKVSDWPNSKLLQRKGHEKACRLKETPE